MEWRRNKVDTATQGTIVTGFTPKQHVPVGGEILSGEPIEYNANRYTAKLVVRNTGTVPSKWDHISIFLK